MRRSESKPVVIYTLFNAVIVFSVIYSKFEPFLYSLLVTAVARYKQHFHGVSTSTRRDTCYIHKKRYVLCQFLTLEEAQQRVCSQNVLFDCSYPTGRRVLK